MGDFPKLSRGHGLGAVQTLPDHRDAVDAQEALSSEDRDLLLEQARILIEDLYAHLPLKQAMHAVDPVQRLRLLRHRSPLLDERDFHADLLDIFTGLRDLHTTYGPPAPLANLVAFLGVFVERYRRDGEDAFLVSKINPNLVTEPTLTEGVELTHFGGMPVGLAVWRNAQREGGSNLPARRARGLQNLTLRDLGRSLPPEEDWVDLRYLVEGEPHEIRLPWRVFEIPPPPPAPAPAEGDAGLADVVGLDLTGEVLREAKRRLFAPGAVREAARVARSTLAVPRASAAQKATGEIPTSRPLDLTARIVTTSHGTFGHLRLWTFHMADKNVNAYLNETIRLLEEELPPEGLILDVRGNGGGYVAAAEFLLQLVSPRRIEPEPAQFINRPATLDLAGKDPGMTAWLPSIAQAVETGAQFSAALPLTDPDFANLWGQIYHGPVVLVTDAFCYSACDMFAAGFADHGIGPVLGVDANTGAGGANVLEHQDLVARWTGGPMRPLPGGATMRVAIRRTLRVGAAAGQPVEDLGVVPDELHDLTREDVLNGNPDLLEHAAALLAARTPRVLEAAVTAVDGTRVTLTLTTKALDSIDVYVDGRPQPQAGIPTPDGTSTLTVELATPGKGTIRMEGFDSSGMAASRLVKFP